MRRPREWFRRLVAVMRWLHVYVSMLGFFALVFFAVTGITLNHPDWFYAGHETAREVQGKIDLALLGGESAGSGEPIGSADSVDKLAIVELLRGRHDLKGALSEFSVDEYQCIVVFKGPGYAADAFIDRPTGEYDLAEVRKGTVAVINDLHKGRDTGVAWSWVVDISAVVMTIASVTGMALLLFFKRRRLTGLIAAAVGTVVVILVYVLCVP